MVIIHPVLVTPVAQAKVEMLMGTLSLTSRSGFLVSCASNHLLLQLVGGRSAVQDRKPWRPTRGRMRGSLRGELPTPA
ncbi:MAG: hypothetical protein VKI81_05270 [Synechococcaceae cyanobacterium]|nr:hypothetical protein [Synechococcaceae cyanobacterium]